jgi:hypothetical protein
MAKPLHKGKTLPIVKEEVAWTIAGRVHLEKRKRTLRS